MEIKLKQLEHLFFDRVRSDMIAKAIDRSIIKKSLKTLGLHSRVYEWTDAWSLIRNYEPILIYLIFKSINQAKMIGISNLKGEIDKATLDKFGNNIKDLLDDISSNYLIIIYKGENHEDYVRLIFKDLLSGPNSTFNRFIEKAKDY